jgi:malate dehydrogenase (oxaloacetate-decarboxylating)
MRERVIRSKKEGKEIVEVDMRPTDILRTPILNKGTAFTKEERKELGLYGFLPCSISTIDEQVDRCYVNFQEKTSSIAKYLFLTNLQNRNETLFYRFLSKHPEEMLPLIYTPTVGEASLCYHILPTQKRGVYFSYPLKDRVEEIVSSIPNDRVDVVVVTDGERILGLGDQGTRGMAIPIGKLSLYTLFGGIHPAYTLPVVIDVGTNNQDLLCDPFYMGWRHERITGKEYDDFIDAVVQALIKRFPHILIQWEDFSKSNAGPLLRRYQNSICCFNDDIQGTAGVVVAGLFAALKSMNASFKDQRIVFFGSGSAGIGIANLLTQAMKGEGISTEEAKEKIYVLGRKGLAHTASEGLDDLKKQFAQSYEKIKSWSVKDSQNISLLEVVSHVKPTILIGTSTQPHTFTEEIVREMKKHVARPIIFPLSNPTSKSEAAAEDLIRWTEGEALIATGSPFPPFVYKEKTFSIGQCNNVFIFPGVGLGVIASRARRVTDTMFLRSAEVLSHFAPIMSDPYGALFPKADQLRIISKQVALTVGRVAIEEGLSSLSKNDLEKVVDETMWKPEYPVLKRLKSSF